MITGYENKILRVNSPLRGLKEGSEIKVRVDKSGNVVDSYWRRRLKDAHIDGSCEIIETKKKKSKTETEE